MTMTHEIPHEAVAAGVAALEESTRNDTCPSEVVTAILEAGITAWHAEDRMEGFVGPDRRKLPRERRSVTRKFTVAGHEGYITAGTYEDGSLGEIFLADIGKEGSTMRGVMDGFAIMFSIALQYGAPLDMLCRKLAHMKFEPRGETDDERIPQAASFLDYIARWLALRFGDEALQEELRLIGQEMGL